MNLTQYPSPDAFLGVMRLPFELDEVANGLMYGISLRCSAHPELFNAPYFAVVADGAGPVAAAMMTPPHNLVLWVRPNSNYEEPLRLIAQNVATFGVLPPGVLGLRDVASVFVDIWQKMRPVTARIAIRERIYQLRKVNPPAPCPGKFRMAAPADAALVEEWFWAFTQEAGVTGDEQSARKSSRLRVDSGDAFVWEDAGQVVSLACRGRSTPHGATIGPVYTPRQFRGKGYASNCVGRLSQLILDGGKDFATLFTDLANPTSNGIYMNLGYTPHCDVDEWRFV
jgi:predicted GNAT family acetyltransferase